MAKSPVAPKQQCLDVQAGFLHAVTVKNISETESAIKKLTPTQCIFTHLKKPYEVLKGVSYQYVNFEKPTEVLRDLGFEKQGGFVHADRMGYKPRIVVRFQEKKVFTFKLELVPVGPHLRHSANERSRNDRFKEQLKLTNGGSEAIKTNASGYYIVNKSTSDKLFLSAAGGNKYYIKVTVLNKGMTKKNIYDFKENTIQTARYFWMLPVIGGGWRRWKPSITHLQNTKNPNLDCMRQSIITYKNDAFIHINRYSLKPLYAKNYEFLESLELEQLKKDFVSLVKLASFHKTGTRCPPEMNNYIFVALMTRIRYEKTQKMAATQRIPLDGRTYLVDLRYMVRPFESNDKSYIIKITASQIINGAKRAINKNLKNYVRAINGYDENGKLQKTGGYVGCRNFEVQTKDLPRGGHLEIKIDYEALIPLEIAGTQWNDPDKGYIPTGFYFFTTERFIRNKAKQQVVLTPYAVETLSRLSSHELGHALQMVASGRRAEPDKTDNYYDRSDPILKHRGGHCKTGVVVSSSKVIKNGTCLMYGTLSGGKTFCSSTANSCMNAIRKVDLEKPFRGKRGD